MPPKPAVSLAAVAGRRKATLELAQRLEQEGFSGIYCPSFGDGMGLCEALALTTPRSPLAPALRTSIRAMRRITPRLQRSFTNCRRGAFVLVSVSVTDRPMTALVSRSANLSVIYAALSMTSRLASARLASFPRSRWPRYARKWCNWLARSRRELSGPTPRARIWRQSLRYLPVERRQDPAFFHWQYGAHVY